MLLEVDFYFFKFFLLPMGRWRVVQVEPLEISTIVDNGIILRGLFRLVRGGGVRSYVLHLREGFVRLIYKATGIWICRDEICWPCTCAMCFGTCAYVRLD